MFKFLAALFAGAAIAKTHSENNVINPNTGEDWRGVQYPDGSWSNQTDDGMWLGEHPTKGRQFPDGSWSNCPDTWGDY